MQPTLDSAFFERALYEKKLLLWNGTNRDGRFNKLLMRRGKNWRAMFKAKSCHLWPWREYKIRKNPVIGEIIINSLSFLGLTGILGPVNPGRTTDKSDILCGILGYSWNDYKSSGLIEDERDFLHSHHIHKRFPNSICYYYKHERKRSYTYLYVHLKKYWYNFFFKLLKI